MEALNKVGLIANNLANVNTTGFKRDRCNFEDFFYPHPRPCLEFKMLGASTRRGIQTGCARRCRATQADKRGVRSSRPITAYVAIQGKWLFASDRSDPGKLYTRAGIFR